MEDIELLWVLVGLLWCSSVLRIALARKKKQPLALLWRLQAFVFPVVMLAGTVSLQLGKGDYVVTVIMLGLLEEIVCFFLRRRHTDI